MAETEGSGNSQDAALDRLAEIERAEKAEAEKAEAIKAAAAADEALVQEREPQSGVEAPEPAAAEAATEALSAPQTYVVQAGDSLSAISLKVYGDAKYWDTIFEHNKDKISDPNVIHPGQELVIP